MRQNALLRSGKGLVNPGTTRKNIAHVTVVKAAPGEGREGHFGLRGMRERAKGIGGKLEIWSQPGAGTEVELIVPASVAYVGQTGRRSWLFRIKVGTNS